MAVSDSAKVDLLYKKLFGVAKTDLPANKSPSNESIASPALNRGDKVWLQSSSIPTVAAAVTNIVQAYQTTSRVECVADTTSVPIGGVYPTWRTNLTDWIPPEFGSTYFIKVYADVSGTVDPTGTTPLSDTGIGSTGEWYFDYQSGVLNFIGGTIPSALTAGKVIFITGYRYIGTVGLDAFINSAYSNANVAAYLPTYTGNLRAGNLFAANISAGNIQGYFNGAIGANVANTGAFTSITATGNISGNLLISSALYANTIGNTSATLVGLVGTNNQPHITSVGTLSTLAVSGNATVGNINAVGTNGQFIGYHTGAIGFQIPNTGAFTTVTASGTNTANIHIANAVYANTIGNTNTTLVGQIGTNAQPFITSVGSLTSLTVTGNTTVGNITATGSGGQLIGYHTGAIGANVPNTGAFTNVTMSGTANINTMTAATIAAASIGNSGTSLTGTLTTANQPNITGLGSLTALTVTGNATVGNLRTSGQVVGYLNGVIGANAPNSATFTNLVVADTLTLNGNSVLTTSNIGNFYLFQNTITVTNTDGDINLTPNGNGLVIVNSTQALTLPVGNNLNRPASPTEGMIRFNTALNVLEMYDGSTWQVVSSTISTTIISDTFTGDGSNTAFTLTQNSTTGGTLVTVNGVIQIPDVSYSVTGTSLQFVEAPVSTDVIEARILTTTSTTTSMVQGNASVSFDTPANNYSILFEVSNNNKVIISNLNTFVNNTLRVGNIIPQANVAYNLGNANFRFDNLWLSGTTIYLGSLTLKDNNGKFGVYDASGNNPVELSSSSINNTPIGNATPSIGVFTSLTTSGGGQITGYHTGAIGANTPNSGAFTTLTASGNINIDSGTLFTDSVNNRVGIGNTAPAHVLSVTGNAAISTSLTVGTGIFWPNGNVYTGVTYTASASSPTTPRTGDQWYNTTNDILYTRVNDSVSDFWLDISSLPSTFANVTVTGNLTVSGNVNSSILPVVNNTYNLGSASRSWGSIYGVAVNAQYADLAENYTSDGLYEYGNVVVFGGTDEITLSTKSHDPAVAGVISYQPAYLMNANYQGLMVALQGRVLCNVKGPVNKGDCVVTSDIPGVAEKIDYSKYVPGAILGKALETITTSEVKMIEVVVGRV